MNNLQQNIFRSIAVGIAISTFAFSATSLAAIVSNDEVPGAPQKNPILLTGGTIHPISGTAIEGGELLFENGKITAIGKTVKKPEGTKTIDLKGKHVYPGMIESHSHMGLTEIAAVRATNDFRETGEINPNVKALVSVYPDNVIIPVTRANGVLFALTAPSGGLISGKSSVIQLDGWTYEDLAVKSDTAMHINWPSQTLSRRQRARMTEKQIKEAEKNREKQLHQIRDLFDQSRAYRDIKNANDSSQKYDARLEAMIDVVDGKIPMMIRADKAADIQSAVAFGAEQKLKVIILGGYDAESCADLLKANDVPVIISAVYRLPQRRAEGYDVAYSLPYRLQKAGVKYCISGTDRSETWNARILPYHAATAVPFGISQEEAMKTITLYAAQILGVDDRIGSLEVGKDASLIITDGSPLETTTHTVGAFIQGRKVDLSNRHLRLYKKYEQKYKQ
ncbi:MAG: amidohydrolase family protein [Mariniblastus sp.]